MDITRLSCDKSHPGATRGWFILEESFLSVAPWIIEVPCFITGNTAEHLAGRKCQTYGKEGAVLRETERIVIVLETTFIFPSRYSTKPQHGTIRHSSASAGRHGR